MQDVQSRQGRVDAAGSGGASTSALWLALRQYIVVNSSICVSRFIFECNSAVNPPPPLPCFTRTDSLPNPLFQFQSFMYNVVNPSICVSIFRYRDTCTCPHAHMHPYNAADIDMYSRRHAYRHNEKLGMISVSPVAHPPLGYEYKYPAHQSPPLAVGA